MYKMLVTAAVTATWAITTLQGLPGGKVAVEREIRPIVSGYNEALSWSEKP